MEVGLALRSFTLVSNADTLRHTSSWATTAWEVCEGRLGPPFEMKCLGGE